MSKDIKACLTHKTDNWKTPTEIYNRFMELGYKDTFKYESKENELENNYYNEKLFINPPFSKMKKITEWIIKQLEQHNEILLLIPSRTDTEYFHRLLTYNPIIYMIKGRLHYNDSKSAPFPTLLLHFNNNWWLKMPIYKQITQKELIKCQF